MLFDSEVGKTDINVQPNPDGKGSLLRVSGLVNGPAVDGLRILRESMLHRYIGSGTDSWKLAGEMETQVNISVPLEANAPGATQQIDIDLSSPFFEIGNLKLHMTNVKGHINYSHDKGIASDGLHATLFNEPIKALLSTNKQGESSQTLIDVKGEVESTALAGWAQRPEVLFLQGKIPYDAHIELNHKARASDSVSKIPYATIAVTSPLKGVLVNLPAPYGKVRDEQRQLIFKMSMREQTSLIDVNYGNNLQTLFELDARGSALRNANIALGGHAKLADEPTFLLSGRLPNLNIEPWKKVFDSYLDSVAQLDAITDKHANVDPQAITVQTNDTYVAGLPFRANVILDHYEIGPLDLHNVDVNAQRLAGGWKIQFSNPVVSGDVFLPNEKTKPIKIDLDNLYLTRNIIESKTADLSTPAVEQTVSIAEKNESDIQKLNSPSVDPRSLPLADISVKELFLDGGNYGNWSLKIRPNKTGTLFDDIRGTIRGITIAGADDANAGAKLDWHVTNEARAHVLPARLPRQIFLMCYCNGTNWICWKVPTHVFASMFPGAVIQKISI